MSPIIEISGESKLLTKLEPQWKDLLEKCQADPIFNSPSWIQNWLAHFGNSNDKLRLILLKESQNILGIAGLYLTIEQWGIVRVRALTPLGRSTAEYLDLIFPSATEETYAALLESILQCKDWDVLSLSRLPQHSLTRESMKDAAAKLGLTVVEEKEEVCPFIELKGSFDTYMRERFSGKFRNNIQRNRKKLGKLGMHRLEILTDSTDLDVKLSMVFDLDRRSWKGKRGLGIFGNEEKRSFFSEIAKSMASHDSLALHLQFLEDGLISYIFGFKSHEKVYVYSMGFDPDFGKYSPGTISIADLLNWSFENHVKIFDFLRGGEKYKKLWTDTATQNVNLHIFFPSVKSRALSSALKTRLALRRLKRQIRPPENEADFEILNRA